jgi:uncharacterized protein (DUF1810 family)
MLLEALSALACIAANVSPLSEDPMTDESDLQRFVEAQAGCYAQVRTELAAGRKSTHWMWFIFPQLRGLGHSPTAWHFGISTLAEARAYLEHPVLGSRLRECARLLLAVQGRSIGEILGHPDDVKLRSCLTLFAQASEGEALFERALQTYYHGEHDERTLELLRRER